MSAGPCQLSTRRAGASRVGMGNASKLLVPPYGATVAFRLVCPTFGASGTNSRRAFFDLRPGSDGAAGSSRASARLRDGKPSTMPPCGTLRLVGPAGVDLQRCRPGFFLLARSCPALPVSTAPFDPIARWLGHGRGPLGAIPAALRSRRKAAHLWPGPAGVDLPAVGPAPLAMPCRALCGPLTGARRSG